MIGTTAEFTPFIGFVEDVQDPLELGRARVRVLNHHDENIETEDLIWATPIIPQSTAIGGAGSSPTWLSVGTTVIGFYIDGKTRQNPLILGAINLIPNGDVSKHSVSDLARGKGKLQRSKIGPEPENPAAPEYPYNKVISTPGGHVVELDDTPGNERVNIHHKSGAYIEINTDGRVVIKSEDDRFDIIGGDETKFTKGNSHQTVKKDLQITVEGSAHITAKKDISVVGNGNVTLQGASVRIN